MIVALDKTFVTLFLTFFHKAFADVYKLGCAFQDENYREAKMTSIFEPFFGKPVQPIELNSVKDLETIISSMEYWNDFVLSTYRYNSVNGYISFYNAYNSKRSMGLSKFFDSYQVPFRPKEDGYSLVIEALNRLVEDIPELAKHVYLGTVELTGLSQMINYLKYASKLPSFYTHDAVVGVVRFQLKNRKGFLISDLNYFVKNPIILMDDGGPLPCCDQSQKFEDSDGLPMTYSLVPGGNKTFAKTTIDPLDNSEPFENLIYLDEPFCSVLQVTAKFGLLYPAKMLIEPTSNARTASMLYFQMDPNNPYRCFTVVAYDKTLGTEDSFRVPFLLVDSPVVGVQKISQVMKVRIALKYKRPEFVRLLSSLKIIAKDEDFHKEVAKLINSIVDKRNNLMKEERKKQLEKYSSYFSL